MRFLWCAYLWFPIPRSWDQFFTYPNLAFSRRNVLCPPQPHVLISICLTYVHSYLNMFAPWKWQVRRRSTAGFRSIIGLPHPASFHSSHHPCINSPPPLLPPRLSTPDDALPMTDCLNLRGKPSPTHFPPYSRNCSFCKHTSSNYSNETYSTLIHSLIDYTPLSIAPWPSSNVL